ncbi:MAG: LysM peptidoglycan-binding domain-containing protein [Verrucomicrobiae bacterium]|nr:LysM peptidoglycan-binding domain-containing protein [Verrucomicrobiae bacterium]
MLAAALRSSSSFCVSLLLVFASACQPGADVSQDPKRDGNFMRGQNLLAQMDYEGAARAFSRALAGNPNSAPAHFEMGFLCKDRTDDPASAIYHFQKFLTLEPESEQTRLITRHIDDCKMELAKLFLIAPVVPDIQKELDHLKDVVKQLEGENEKLRYELTTRPTPPATTPTAPEPDPTPAAESPKMLATAPPSPIREEPEDQNVFHTIKNGDYPVKIARRYGVKVEALLKANPGLDPRRLKIGMKVSIPTG